MKTIQERARENGLTVNEQDAFEAVAEHVNRYLSERIQHYGNGISLSSYVLSALIDDGTIAGIELGRDTLEVYSSSLNSALAKLESRLPEMPTHPLAPVI